MAAVIQIDLNDARLTKYERQTLRTIALRINGGLVVPPQEYRAKAEAMFDAICAADGCNVEQG